MDATDALRRQLLAGQVIPACPLALTPRRRFDERRQCGLCHYYLASGVGGIAVGVHTTQFAIHRPKVGLYRPVLEVVIEALRAARPGPSPSPTRPPGASGHLRERPLAIAGLCGRTLQALAEATLARDLGYDAGLLSLGALPRASEAELLAHCRAVATILPLFGFYLQPAAGGRCLSLAFWRRFSEIAAVVAIKIAPFNRYRTLDVVRAVVESGREDIALYTGNDDHILLDLLTPYSFKVGTQTVRRYLVGGLLGQWAVWTQTAVRLHARCREVAQAGAPVPTDLLRLANELTDANAAVFDAAHAYAGCLPGIHEVLRRQGLLAGRWCLDPTEGLSPGQGAEIDRVCRAYPHLTDDAFVARHLAEGSR